MVSTASARMLGTSTIATLAMLVFIGVLFYWCTAIVVLGSWMGANVTQRRFFGRAAVVTGFASVWLVPLTISWIVAAVIFAKIASPWIVDIRWMNATTTRLMLPAAGAVCVTVLPAAMVAMALRMAGGLGEALGEAGANDDKLCETCGYNLHATAFDRRCPECGRPACQSLSPIHRHNRWEVGQAGLAPTALALLLNPAKAFGTLRIRHGLGAAKRFLAGSAILSAALLAALLTLANLIASAPGAAAAFSAQHLSKMAARAAIASILWAGLWAIGVTVVSMIVASLISSTSRRNGDRLGGRGALKMACYLSVLAIPWAAMIGGLHLLACHARNQGLLLDLSDESRTLIATVIGIGLLIWYWLTASRAYFACRFANT